MRVIGVWAAMGGSGEVGAWDVVGFQNKTYVPASSFKPTFRNTYQQRVRRSRS